MPRTQAFGYYAQNFLALAEIVCRSPSARPTPMRRANGCGRCGRSEVVLARGAIERPLVFPDNDRPGVMLADAARALSQPLRRKVGERVVVATAHDSAYRAALDLPRRASKSRRSSICATRLSGRGRDGRARAPASKS